MDPANVIELVVGFSLIIFVHELGHFLAAKYVGIRCEQFAIGFGHAVLSWRKGLGFRIGSSEAECAKRIAERASSKITAEKQAEGKTEPTAVQLKAASD